jgi:hypothetical protein
MTEGSGCGGGAAPGGGVVVGGPPTGTEGTPVTGLPGVVVVVVVGCGGRVVVVGRVVVEVVGRVVVEVVGTVEAGGHGGRRHGLAAAGSDAAVLGDARAPGAVKMATTTPAAHATAAARLAERGINSNLLAFDAEGGTPAPGAERLPVSVRARRAVAVL